MTYILDTLFLNPHTLFLETTTNICKEQETNSPLKIKHVSKSAVLFKQQHRSFYLELIENQESGCMPGLRCISL